MKFKKSKLEKVAQKICKRLYRKEFGDEQKVFIGFFWDNTENKFFYEIEYGSFFKDTLTYWGSSPSCFKRGSLSYRLTKKLEKEFIKKINRQEKMYLPKQLFAINPWTARNPRKIDMEFV